MTREARDKIAAGLREAIEQDPVDRERQLAKAEAKRLRKQAKRLIGAHATKPQGR